MRRLLVFGVFLLGAVSAQADDCRWPQWETFAAQYIDKGRVVDGSDPRQITTSEGQAYGLFFALIAGDRARFDQLLNWTETHLAAGDLSRHLPAWLWGQDADGGWRVLDQNAASDADLWMVYALNEAGRLWREHRYRSKAYWLAKRIVADESRVVAEHDRLLLPGPEGFVLADGDYRLNPSYVPPQLLQSFAHNYPHSAWPAMAASSQRWLLAASPKGFAPDWLRWRDGQILPDPKHGSQGSYDAIRVYLWLGMMHADAEGRDALLAGYTPMIDAVLAQNAVPERWNAVSGEYRGRGPFGFKAAMLPLLKMAEQELAASRFAADVVQAQSESKGRQAYYSQVLSLFGLGWWQGRYRFDAQGQLTGVCS
ncbi:cellulose synthase complex periplasmic endoglucanase BcsZ [Spongiibacter tropicus]|uniref:cellulose synthase complex periplasmic endoglucanase BcsZ n=1 Tax=Spongiibacter tropicus TaxID=454602 RepID=UPI0003B6FD83|nr:cellulose synthase complex periplasmic endoglucanase BcsZ [Spongiibacter tropicus]